MKIMLAIDPKYAELIFRGLKKWEYRRRIPKESFETVELYATAPISKVVGRFTVGHVLTGSVDSVWASTAPFSGLNESEYRGYFAGAKEAHAIQVTNVIKYKHPRGVDSFFLCLPPQSWVYIRSEKGAGA